jgi:hypothetical protein
MAHECFEDAETAALMNRHFVNIKVDREERPDIDQIYQTAHQLMAQRPGGWPLTMFLTPEGKPFFGGTYFPKRSRYNLPGFDDAAQVSRPGAARQLSPMATLAPPRRHLPAPHEGDPPTLAWPRRRSGRGCATRPCSPSTRSTADSARAQFPQASTPRRRGKPVLAYRAMRCC